MCDHEEETLQHLFVECDMVQRVRSYIHDVIYVRKNPSVYYMNGI
jgi:hypothetical protein